ncbi:hypothetical protein [Roseofilum casamattae]|uniref:Uncharacterized protein n=1 Tax=Roseofilum casamattae BLCC-M143 TaxID=3022442 RepID=A0ABT7C1K2_9CYAN|nr:hypothetical protein [Roseofilum casamattae]MDJ1185305.1 hypothetical protein [Roseofilum casamattae BLCC-M143]
MRRSRYRPSPNQNPSWIKRQLLNIVRSLMVLLQAIANSLQDSNDRDIPNSPYARSDRNFNGFDIAVGTIILLAIAFFLWVSLFPNPSVEIASLPNPEIVSEPVPLEENEAELPEVLEPNEISVSELEDNSLEVPIPEISEEIDTLPELENELEEERATEEIESEIPEKIAELDEPENPDRIPETLALAEPIPVRIRLPKIPPILTPEQRLIAAIQEQISDLDGDNSRELIDSVRADFLNSILQIKVKSQWSKLPLEEQQTLADAMLQKSKKLDFTRLEIRDNRDRLLARSSATGVPTVILLQSSLAIAKTSNPSTTKN